MKSFNRISLCALVAMVFVVAGCKKFTMERFDTMVYKGQSKMEVKKVIGEPWQETDDMWYYRDKDTLDSAKVKFNSSGHVIDKQWDGRDKHPDAKPGAMDINEPGTVIIETTEVVD